MKNFRLTIISTIVLLLLVVATPVNVFSQSPVPFDQKF